MRTLEEEVINAYSHLITAIISAVICFIYLNRIDDQLQQIQFAVFTIGSTWTFFSSFLYHVVTDPKLKERNLVLDRVGIYVMIMVTGISFSLGSIEDTKKIFFCVMIVVANSYLILKYCKKKSENELYSVITYLLFAIVCILPITGAFNKNMLVTDATLGILTFGLLSYAAGVVFYTIDSKKWAHTMWHLFVSIGYCACTSTLLIAFNVA